MKKFLSIVLIVVIVALINACSYQFNKDGLTGLETNASILSYEDCGLFINQERINTNEVGVGQEVECVFLGVSGFKQEDGMCYIGASMILTDKNNNEVFNEADLFAHYDDEGLSPEDASNLTLKLITGSPMVAGENYIWSMRIWDKRSEGEITSKVTVKLK